MRSARPLDLRAPPFDVRVAPLDRAAVVLAAVLLVVFAATGEETKGNARDFDGWGALILAAGVGVLALRRRFPASVALTVLALTALWYHAGYTNGIANALVVVAFYTVGTTGDRRRQLLVGTLAVTLLVLGIVVFAGEPWVASVDAIGYTVASILFGEVVHGRRMLLAEYRSRAEQAEAEREALAERRVAEERLRIARELHDVLAHTVSTMALHAGVAADRLGTDPGRAREALATVRSASREAMDELRATVAVLRAGEADAARAPAPGLDRMPDLVDVAAGAGLRLDVVTEGEPRPLPAHVELTAYRIVQEAVTNVLRHSEARRAVIGLGFRPEALEIEVADGGPARDGSEVGTGFGLVGMTERVQSVGGELAYGPVAGGGFNVRARLPVPARAG